MRKRQIVSAARRLIVKYGSEHVTVKRIAREIGVSESAIYRHFKSKKDILSLLADHIRDYLVGDITRATTSDISALEALDKIFRSHISAVEQRRGISFQVIAEIVSFGDKKLNKKMYDVIDDYIKRIRGILSDGVKKGLIREDIDLDAFATLFFGTIQGLVNMWALSNYSFNLEERYVPIFTTLRQAIIKG